MKRQSIFFQGFTMPRLYPVLLLSLSFFFFSCKKNVREGSEGGNQSVLTSNNSRLLTVANVLEKEGGSTIEVWFFETPLIHEFSLTATNARAMLQLLKQAESRNEPVHVSVALRKPDFIESVSAATAEEISAHKLKKSDAELAIEAENAGNQRATALTAVVPNTTTLNNIFGGCSGGSACPVFGPYLSGQCIPYQYVADGCYARAHKMREVIEGFYGYTSYKVFHFLNRCVANPGSLAVRATLWGNNCCVQWWYHVAPYVIVQSGASQVAYVIDPSMFTGPVSITTWANAQKNASCGSGTVFSKLAYYTSSAYAPSGFNFTTCVANIYADNTYTAANNTCAAYAPLQGCF